jgi:carboxypeptidase T
MPVMRNPSKLLQHRFWRSRSFLCVLALSVVLGLFAGTAVLSQAGARDDSEEQLENNAFRAFFPTVSHQSKDTESYSQYRVTGVFDKYQRTALARLGASIDAAGDDWVEITANSDVVAAIQSMGYRVEFIPPPRQILAFPPDDADYHDYAEMVAEINQAANDHPDLVSLFSIGQSYEGRDLWVAKISDNPTIDEGEPEVLFTFRQHAREHLAIEQGLYILRILTDEYPSSVQIKHLVDAREIFIAFDANPDGGEYDHSGTAYYSWRKNRQPNQGTEFIGTDLNRNWEYQWNTTGASSDPSDIFYQGPAPFSAPETDAIRTFVESRVISDVQQIKLHIDFHTYGELVMWPYGYTFDPLPADMTADDHATFVTMGNKMAALNGYTPQQSSALYEHGGIIIDWMYAVHNIFAFTFELYPVDASGGGFYPGDEIIPAETARNRDAVLYALELADCPYRAICKQTTYCATTTEPAPVSELGLQGFWNLNETCQERMDGSVHNNHLADGNAVTHTIGYLGLSAELDASRGNFLAISDTVQSGLDVTGSLTLFGWVKPTVLGQWQVLASKYEIASDDRAYRLDLRPDNKIGFVVSPDGTLSDTFTLEVSPPLTLILNSWYHIAAVFDAVQKSLSIYFNGDLIGSRTVPYDRIHDSSAPFALGANWENGQPSQHLYGRLDEWGIYDRALDGTEIANVMVLNTPTPTPTSTPTSTPTNTPTATPTSTTPPEATPTDTPEATPTDTPTPEPSPTPTQTPTPSVPPSPPTFLVYLPLISRLDYGPQVAQSYYLPQDVLADLD